MSDHQVRSVAEDGGKSAAIIEQTVVERESGLQRKLSARQVAMIGLGCTIGTGLFLGSAIAVKLAGPAVLLSFLGGAFIALTVMWALAEMSVEHPTAGAFGLHAVRRRLELRFPAQSSLRLESSPQGTRSIVELPRLGVARAT